MLSEIEVLSLSHVGKNYGAHQVLKDLNLEIQTGSLFGLIGPNGVGKTTLIKCILNQLDYSGEIRIEKEINSHYLSHSMKNIVYVPEDPFVYEYLTGLEFIHFILDIHHIPFSTAEENRTAVRSVRHAFMQKQTHQTVFIRHEKKDHFDFGFGAESQADAFRRTDFQR